MTIEDRQCDSHTSRRTRSFALSVAVLFGGAVAAQADSAVILGAGQIGNWITTGSLVNPNSSPAELVVAPSPILSPGGISLPCSISEECADVTVPALGSGSLPLVFAGIGFGTVYATQTVPVAAGQRFPIVQASLQEEDACRSIHTNVVLRRSVNIPVILLSKLVAANLSTLNFPDVALFPEAQGLGAYSNLVLGNIEKADGTPGEDLPLRLELFDSPGSLIGSASLVLSYGETLVLGNPVSYLGAPGFVFSGHLRLTRVSGGALMWGILYTVDPAVGVIASSGTNLSP